MKTVNSGEKKEDKPKVVDPLSSGGGFIDPLSVGADPLSAAAGGIVCVCMSIVCMCVYCTVNVSYTYKRDHFAEFSEHRRKGEV